jgi:hypothetical protein
MKMHRHTTSTTRRRCIGSALLSALVLFRFAVPLAFVASLPLAAPAAVISSWGFEALTTTNTGITPIPSAGSLLSDTGNGEFLGVHLSGATVWSNPVGNGSTKSISSNNWSVGDVWQFTSNTTGFNGIMIMFDATSSNTGPRDFKVQYSTTGALGTYTDAPGATYTLVNSAFSGGSQQFTTPPRFLFDFSTIPALDNNANVAFRLVDTSATAVNGGAVGTAGTSRIDNVIVGTNLVIPEPASAAGLLTWIGLTLVASRRRAGPAPAAARARAGRAAYRPGRGAVGATAGAMSDV